jgi:hypothetical protein
MWWPGYAEFTGFQMHRLPAEFGDGLAEDPDAVLRLVAVLAVQLPEHGLEVGHPAGQAKLKSAAGQQVSRPTTMSNRI